MNKLICKVDKENRIINIVNCQSVLGNNGKVYYPWNRLGDIYTDIEPFSYMQQRLYTALGAEFANRRDAVRWINLPSGNRYGFDCAVEDISNFMAAYTPLLIADSGETGYKVWKSETEKGLVILPFADMQAAYDYVRDSQLSAYKWLSSAQEKVKAVTEADGKEKLQAVYDACIATPTK